MVGSNGRERCIACSSGPVTELHKQLDPCFKKQSFVSTCDLSTEPSSMHPLYMMVFPLSSFVEARSLFQKVRLLLGGRERGEVPSDVSRTCSFYQQRLMSGGTAQTLNLHSTVTATDNYTCLMLNVVRTTTPTCASQTSTLRLTVTIASTAASTIIHKSTQANTTESVERERSKFKPTESRRKAVLGHRDDSFLRIPWRHVETAEEGQQAFVKRNASEIQWNNQDHINDINNWINHNYSRTGLKERIIQNWQPGEKLWFEL